MILGQIISGAVTTTRVAAACDRLIRTATVAQARDIIFAIQAIYTSAEDHPNVSAGSRGNILEHHGNVDRVEEQLAPFVPETAATSTLAFHQGTLCSAMSLASILAELPGVDMAEQAELFRELVDALYVAPPLPVVRHPGLPLVVGGLLLFAVGAATAYSARRL